MRGLARAARRLAERVVMERRYSGAEVLREDVGAPGASAGPDRNAYAPTPWRLLLHVLPPREVAATDVFADFGCGKGRVLLEAAECYRFARVLGVEADPALAQAARTLLAANGIPRWEVATADVAGYAIPGDVTVAYLFDPFTGPVFAAFLDALEASVARRPRRVRVIYVVPRELAQLEDRASVRVVMRGAAGWLRTGGRYEYCVAELGEG